MSLGEVMDTETLKLITHNIINKHGQAWTGTASKQPNTTLKEIELYYCRSNRPSTPMSGRTIAALTGNYGLTATSARHV